MDPEIISIVERELNEPPDTVVPIEEGLLHETYEVQCNTGAYILQFASAADEDRHDSMSRGLNCYRMLQNTDIPVPGVVTETISVVHGRQYTLVEKLPGTTGECDISPERALNAGRWLAKIHHSRRFDTAGWPRFEDQQLFIDAFEENTLKHRIQRGVVEHSIGLRDGGLAAVGDAVERVFDRLGEKLPIDVRPVLCHNDYSPDNILFQHDEVTGILDFDRAYAGHQQRDLVKAANCFWMHDPCADWDVRATVYEGYQDVTELQSSFERNEPLYRVETLAGIIAGLLTMNELSNYEQAFYTESILDAADRAEES